MTMNKQTYRYIARIIVEAETPIFVGSGESSLLKDALVQKDLNGLPMIQGTSLTGVLRHSLLDGIVFETIDEAKYELIDIWGYQFNGIKEKEAFQKYYESKFSVSKVKPDGLGSRIKISSAYMMINENEVDESYSNENVNEVKTKYSNLPSRQHARINDRGVVVDKGLFVNEVVYKGTRFIFEIELKGTEVDSRSWNTIIGKVQEPLFRIGQGSRKGYGSLKVIGLYNEIFNLEDSTQFEKYLNWPTSFNAISINTIDGNKLKGDLLEYKLTLTPDDFFIFSEGFGDEDVDNKPLMEEVAIYTNSTIVFQEQTVLPATSIKGAIAHRTCFHYNKLKGRFADQMNNSPKVIDFYKKLWTGGANKAVHDLFGVEEGFLQNSDAKEVVIDYDNVGDANRGKVIINDLYFTNKQVKNDKIFNHVAIDRFTGGAMDGALFSEKVSTLKGDIQINIFVENATYEVDVIQAFENALIDITKGLLPLGGMTTKGNGMFTGSLTKNDIPITNYHKKVNSNDN